MATLLRWIMLAVFVGAGSAKLLGVSSMVALFTAVGFGQWFRYVIGIGELTGALLLASPRTALPGTCLLSLLMNGDVHSPETALIVGADTARLSGRRDDIPAPGSPPVTAGQP